MKKIGYHPKLIKHSQTMKSAVFSLLKHFSTTSTIKPKICVVGSGPAGFYAAQYIAKNLNTAQVDIIEKLPVPFGLVRFGVAPDHSDLKNCINTFIKTAEWDNVSFKGNVALGRDVSLQQLREAYHVVLLTYGVDDSRKLDIKGADLKNVFQAKDFVGWYNGVPWNKNLPVDLSGSRATIFGHGNVAIDVARLLLSSVDKLKATDITAHSLAVFAKSQIKEVCLIGRRGPLQISFTTKELRELLNYKNVCNIWRSEDMAGIPEVIPQLGKRKRITELIVQKFQTQRQPQPDEKLLRMIFFRSPKEFLGNVKVEAVKLGINRLEGEDLVDKKAVMTDKEEIIDTSLVVSSIGYKSVQVDRDIPFDNEKGVVRNIDGKVDNHLYTAGWVGTGASGVLAQTMTRAFGVGLRIIKDISSEGLQQEKPGFEHVKKILDERNVQVVSWKDWLKIDEFEKNEGRKVNKPREKVVDVEEMLRIAAS